MTQASEFIFSICVFVTCELHKSFKEYIWLYASACD